MKQVSDEASKSLTWIHVLNYQTKLSQSSSMRHLNTLRNGLNRFRYSQYFTIGFTPVFKSPLLTSSRLYELNAYLKNSLPVYKQDAQAQPLITEYFRIAARRCNPTRVAATVSTKKPPPPQTPTSSYVRSFANNLSTHLSVNTTAPQEKESSVATLSSSRVIDYSYLQQWPPNYDYASTTIVDTRRINESTTVDTFVEFALSFQWYKNLTLDDDADVDEGLGVTALVAIKDSLSNPKVKSRNLNAKLIIEIHDK